MPTTIHPAALELARLLEPTWPSISARIARSGAPTCSYPAGVAPSPYADSGGDTTSKKLREQLRGIENDLVDARERRAAVVAERDRAREAFASSGNLDQNSAEFKTANKAVADLGRIDDHIASLQNKQIATLKLLGKDGRPNAADRLNAPPWPENSGWDSSPILASPVTRGQLEQMASTTLPMGRQVLGEVASRDGFIAGFGSPMVADVTGTPASRRADWVGVVPQLRRRLRILDLIPMGLMDGNSWPYTRESGSLTTAAETAEGAAKPEAALTLSDEEAVAKTIAHWLKVRKQSLADVPALRTVIDNRLRFGLELRLEAQVLAGTGTGENLTGILNTSGIGAVAFDADELVADQILVGLTTVFLASAEASAVVMHPTDWAAAVKAKADGDGHYYSAGPFGITPQQIWGVPLIPSASIPLGTALVGDFSLGAQLLIREGVQVLLSDSDQDDFIKNKVTMLAEMRAALAVWQPSAFCTVDLAA